VEDVKSDILPQDVEGPRKARLELTVPDRPKIPGVTRTAVVIGSGQSTISVRVTGPGVKIIETGGGT
jgi:hypothetical protein